MWSADRNTLRRVFYDAWRHFKEGRPLGGVEGLIIETLLAHPEYHAVMERGPQTPADEKTANPFLHLSLHIALSEQLTTDRPAGIKAVFEGLCAELGDPHRAQHLMIECLEETLWGAHQSGGAPDEAAYFACLARLSKTGHKSSPIVQIKR